MEINFKNESLTDKETKKYTKDNANKNTANRVLLSDFLGDIKIDDKNFFGEYTETPGLMLPTDPEYENVKKFILNNKITTTYLEAYNSILNTISAENGWNDKTYGHWQVTAVDVLDSLTDGYVNTMAKALKESASFNNLTFAFYDNKFVIGFEFSTKAYCFCNAPDFDLKHYISCTSDKKYAVSCVYWVRRKGIDVRQEKEITADNYKEVRKEFLENTIYYARSEKKMLVQRSNEINKQAKELNDNIEHIKSFIDVCKKALA
jgi:hypothetical protein